MNVMRRNKSLMHKLLPVTKFICENLLNSCKFATLLKNLNTNNMSTVKVAINGFGRIGRLVYRQIYNMEGIEVVAINDLTSPKVLAHLLKYDSAQGRFNAEVAAGESSITVNGDEVKIYAQKTLLIFPGDSTM